MMKKFNLDVILTTFVVDIGEEIKEENFIRVKEKAKKLIYQYCRKLRNRKFNKNDIDRNKLRGLIEKELIKQVRSPWAHIDINLLATVLRDNFSKVLRK